MNDLLDRSIAQTDEAVALAQWMGEEIERLRARNKRLEEALHLAVRALAEAEAILGGEYGDHYGPLCEMMIELGKKARAALEATK